MNVCYRVGRGRSEDKACVDKVFVIRVETPCNACVTLCANLERSNLIGYILFVDVQEGRWGTAVDGTCACPWKKIFSSV